MTRNSSCTWRSAAGTGSRSPAHRRTGSSARYRPTGCARRSAGSFDWALVQGAQGYAVLNACRALRFLADGNLCAKVEAGRWYLSRSPHHPLVAEALVLHQSGDHRELSGAGARFVADARDLLLAAQD